jgi:hypothetical protein
MKLSSSALNNTVIKTVALKPPPKKVDEIHGDKITITRNAGKDVIDRSLNAFFVTAVAVSGAPAPVNSATYLITAECNANRVKVLNADIMKNIIDMWPISLVGNILAMKK